MLPGARRGTIVVETTARLMICRNAGSRSAGLFFRQVAVGWETARERSSGSKPADVVHTGPAGFSRNTRLPRAVASTRLCLFRRNARKALCLAVRCSSSVLINLLRRFLPVALFMLSSFHIRIPEALDQLRVVSSHRPPDQNSTVLTWVHALTYVATQRSL